MSKIVVTMPVRNEAWVFGLSARAALMWCDELLILQHTTADPATAGIIDELAQQYPKQIRAVLIEHSEEWEEMHHRQRLLEEARRWQASHIVIVDADEVLTGNLIPTIRGDIEMTHARTIMQLPWIQLRGGITEYHSAGVWADQWVSFAFRDDPVLHWAARDGYDFHHRHPMGRQLIPFRPVPRKKGGLLHLQMASERRLKAKQALYKMTEVIRWPGRISVDDLNKMYDLTTFGRADKQCRDPHPMAKVPTDWWAPYESLIDKYLKVHADPWQEAECARLWKEHGPDKFAGLDLYGLVK